MHPIINQIQSNLHFKTISTSSRINSYDYFSQFLSTSILKGDHCQMIVCGPRKVGKMRMVRHVVGNLVRIHEKNLSHQGMKRVKVIWVDAVEKPSELLEIVQSSLVTWIRLYGSTQVQPHSQTHTAQSSKHGNSRNSSSKKRGKRKTSSKGETHDGDEMQDGENEEKSSNPYNVHQVIDEFMNESFSKGDHKKNFSSASTDLDSNTLEYSIKDNTSTNLLGNQYDIITDEQLGKLEVLMTAVSTHIYPIFVFRHFDRICKLANKFMYHLLDLMHTTNSHFALIGVSQSINLHTILDKGTGTTGKLGGAIGSYTRIKSRLYSGKFVLLRSFRNENEIIEGIQSIMDLSDLLFQHQQHQQGKELQHSETSIPDQLGAEIKKFNESLNSSLSQTQVFSPLLLYPDCSALVQVCRKVIERIEKRNSPIVTIADWSESIFEWIQNDDRLKHLEYFSNLELCFLLAARDLEEKILTPSQENTSHGQGTEMKEDWFSFNHVYTRFLNEIAKTSNQDIKDVYASHEHMIPDITTNRSTCQTAYRSLFEKGFLKRLNNVTVIEDSKSRFHQIHPQEIRSYFQRNSEKFHTTIVNWAESLI